LPEALASDLDRANAANFDAIGGYIFLEVERNHRDDDERDEAVRQIGVLTSLHDAISRLISLVPAPADMPEKDAVEAEGLVRLCCTLCSPYAVITTSQFFDPRAVWEFGWWRDLRGSVLWQAQYH